LRTCAGDVEQILSGAGEPSQNWAVVAQTRSDHELVRGGPFALMRNPIYVAIGGMMAATALGLGHGWNLVAAIPVYLIGTMMRVVVEEKLLRETFGAPYEEYRRRVKRFIPFIW
jgi:protein-S-isoprenylcysteine O-methyltransferase Ste14